LRTVSAGSCQLFSLGDGGSHRAFAQHSEVGSRPLNIHVVHESLQALLFTFSKVTIIEIPFIFAAPPRTAAYAKPSPSDFLVLIEAI